MFKVYLVINQWSDEGNEIYIMTYGRGDYEVKYQQVLDDPDTKGLSVMSFKDYEWIKQR